MRAFWTDEEEKTLREMIEAGCSMDEIVSVLKSRTVPGIRGKMEWLGLKISNPAEIDQEAFKRIMAERKQNGTHGD